MRQIEEKMLEAIEDRKDWNSGNTEVISNGDGLSWVYLHGNRLACSAYGSIEPDYQTLRTWPTRTTMSRLRALGVDVCTRRGDIYLNGEKLA
jgi:hypothetical protein